jgi:hypothetical protein
MATYDFSLPSVNIPAPQGGLLSGFAGEIGNRLDDRNAANAYNPLLDSIYGAQSSAPGGFLARLFGGAQPAPTAGAMPGAGGIGSDAVASARANAAPQLQANMAPPNMPPRAALEALLGNPQTQAFANHLLARSLALNGGQGWGGAQPQGAVPSAGYPPANGANGPAYGVGTPGGNPSMTSAYRPPLPPPNPLRNTSHYAPGSAPQGAMAGGGANGMAGRQFSAADIPVGQTIVQNGVRFRKYPDGSVRSV